MHGEGSAGGAPAARPETAEGSPRDRLRRRLANELLSAAAQHAIVTDELQDLERARRVSGLGPRDMLHVQELRRRKLVLRLRHDRANRRLMSLLATTRATVDEPAFRRAPGVPGDPAGGGA